MRKLKVIITYKDETYTQDFELGEDELVEDVLNEIQEDWCQEFLQPNEVIEEGDYNIEYEFV